LVEKLQVTQGDSMQTLLDVVSGLANLLNHVVDQGLVLKNKHMRIENGGLFFSKVFSDIGSNPLNLLTSEKQSLLETLDFRILAICGNGILGDFHLSMHEQECRPMSYTRRCGNAMEHELLSLVFFRHD